MRATVYWIEGDGIGADVWKGARPVIDEAVRKVYGEANSIEWKELLAGEKAQSETGERLPQETIDALRNARFAIKGPLGTPVGTGFRSLNVTLRRTLDLYACIRPIRYFEGVSSPVKHPERVNVTIFRENTEDVYAGIEFNAGTDEARRLIAFLRDELKADVDPLASVGIKPMTERGSKRLVRSAIRYALDRGLPNVTLVHKGNIMKHTEGAFRRFGYEVAAQEFADVTTTEAENLPGRKLTIKDRIADAMFQEVLIHPEQYSVLATPNLNGDYLSDAIAAQVGGLGLAPGLNQSETLSFYEATHGTAPTLAGKDRANPGSLILCGAMLLKELGWNEAGDRIEGALSRAIANRTVTEDLASQMPDAKTLGTRAFAEELMRLL
ncbi:MAG: isocitrate/isopropylmalate family dehydrogenase [Desulfovibrionaceae bacterium]|nr:isocitrate/isopropylmalate family dehydrogenase [Desulfovibrionaceae bacterium]